MKKLRLDHEFHYDFSLIGITCTIKEYKLAWKLNHLLEIQMHKEKDIEIEFIKNKKLVISNYLFETENSQIRLLKNKSSEEDSDQSAYLMPELKEFDYLLMVKGFEDTFSLVGLKGLIASIPEVLYSKIFSIDSLKSKENLIF